MRCSIDTSNIYVHHHTTHQAVITCGEYLLRCGIDTSIYIYIYIYIYHSTIRLSRTTAHPRNTLRASSGFGKPPTRLAWSSLFYRERYGLSVTQKGRVSPITRKGPTLLPRLVRRPQHLPFPTAVTGTFHALPSVDLTICRTLPDSANLPPGLYCSAMCPAGQTHFSPNYPLLTTRTSS